MVMDPEVRDRPHAGGRDALIRVARSGERRPVVATLSRAFCPDPMFDHFTRDQLAEHRMLPAFWSPIVADTLRHGRSWVADVNGRVGGFAGWLPPSAQPRGAGREALVALGVARSLPLVRHRAEAGRLLVAMEDHHPREELWYLAILGVDPAHQGRGIGGRLVQPGLDAADADGLPCYLETQKVENLAFYGRFGFEEIDRLDIGTAPPLWLLRREAR